MTIKDYLLWLRHESVRVQRILNDMDNRKGLRPAWTADRIKVQTTFINDQENSAIRRVDQLANMQGDIERLNRYKTHLIPVLMKIRDTLVCSGLFMWLIDSECLDLESICKQLDQGKGFANTMLSKGIQEMESMNVESLKQINADMHEVSRIERA